MRKIKNILLLAGGDSTRFWPLENKLFFSFLGKPLILFQIEELLKYGELITVVANKSNATTIKRLIDNVDIKPVQILVQKEDYPGMAGAVFSAKNHIKGEVLIVNGSDLIDYSIISKLSLLINQENKLILLGKKINEYFPGGYFKFDDNKKVIEIVEKPGKDKLPSSIAKLVFDYFADINILLNHFSQIKTKNDDFYELTINRLLSDDLKQSYFLYDSYWFALKYPWQVLTMMKNFLLTIKETKISTSATVSDKAIIVGPVLIGENVKIGDFCKIVGPTFIDDNSVIGDYSLVRESQIGQDCLIGSYTEVARSYIGNEVFLHRNYVGDSVLDDGVMMGAQAATANFRFDGETVKSAVNQIKINSNLHKFGTVIGSGSKIGVNSVILPGVKIGKNTFISPHHSIVEDIPDNSFIRKGIFKNKI